MFSVTVTEAGELPIICVADVTPDATEPIVLGTIADACEAFTTDEVDDDACPA